MVKRGGKMSLQTLAVKEKPSEEAKKRAGESEFKDDY